MTKNKELFYWQSHVEWYTCDNQGNVTLDDNAPERAKKSFEMWKQWEIYKSDENNFIDT